VLGEPAGHRPAEDVDLPVVGIDQPTSESTRAR
jgi:hypothetical protein